MVQIISADQTERQKWIDPGPLGQCFNGELPETVNRPVGAHFWHKLDPALLSR